MKPSWLFLIFLFWYSCGVSAQEASAQVSREACTERIRSATADQMSTLGGGGTFESCMKTPLEGDLSIQILHFLLGEPVAQALKIFYSLKTDVSSGGLAGGHITTVMYPLHQTLEAFNWFFFVVLVLTISNQLFTQLHTWSLMEERMGFQKWLKLHGGSSFTALFLSAPLIGWMTPVQFIAVSVIVGMTYIAKSIVAYLFFASFFSQTGVDLAREIRPEVSASMEETVLIYYCDLKEREALVNGIVAAKGIHSREALSGVGLFQCLNSGSDAAKVTQGVSDAYNAVYQVVTPAQQNTQQCWTKHEADALRMGLSKPSVCGSISLNLPRSDAGTDTTAIKDSAVAIYLSPSVQNAAREVALQVHEYLCRKDLSASEMRIGGKDAGCARALLSGSGYQYQWVTDDAAGQQVLFKFYQPMSSSARSLAKEDIARAKSALSYNLTNDAKKLLSHLSLMSQAAGGADNALIKRDDAEDLSTRIERGGWLAGSLFFRNISDSMDDSAQADRLAKVYTASSSSMPPLDDLSPILGGSATGAGIVSTKSLSYLFPRLDLFSLQSSCWNEPSSCQASALNPFIDMGRQGTALVGEATLFYMGAKIVSFGSQALFPLQGRGKLMISETLSTVYVLYMLIGFCLAFIIPAYPLFMLMGILVSWSYDVLKSLLDLQISIAQSPMSEQKKAMFSDKVREAGARLFGLAGYFLAVMLGVMMTFFAFSFFYGMNGLIVGWLSNLVGWAGEAHTMEGIVINVIKDVIMTFILFYEVKLCVPFIQRIPQAYLERFEMSMTDNEHIAEMMIRSIRGHILPGVADFISNGKMVVFKRL